jgi:sucrose-6-phosphate hydrolase SacC (GH32 family)
MGNWPTSKWPSRVNGWAGQQSVIREHFIRSDGALGQKPVAELSSLASGNWVYFKDKVIIETITLGSMKLARLPLKVDLRSTTASRFSITTHSSTAGGTVVAY